jgi:hypothetical protein
VQQSKNGVFVAEFFGTREAERATHISQSAISACCLKKIKSAGGYQWNYK